MKFEIEMERQQPIKEIEKNEKIDEGKEFADYIFVFCPLYKKGILFYD